MYKSRWPLTGGLLILSSMLQFTPEVSHAANWRLSENLSVGGIYTDNVRLVEEGKKSRLIGMVTPSILLHGEGRRARFDLAASLIFNTGSDNPVLPRYRALLANELVKNSLFFNVISRAGQGRINPFAAAGSPVVNQTGNFTTTYVNTLNPYFVSRLNGFADLRIDYRYSDFRFSDDTIDPRTQQTLRADLFTNPGSSKISWGLDGYSRKTEYNSDTQADSTRSYVDAVLRYQLNRKLGVAGSVGTGSNTFGSNTRGGTGGSRWYLEARWTPNSRNTFTVRHGGRFFGPYTNLNFYHRARKSVFRLEYRTELRDSSDNLSDQNILPATNLSGQPANPFTNGPFVQPNDFVDLTNNRVYVQDRFRAFYTLTGKRTVLDLVGQYDTRDYLDSSRETIFSRAWVGIQRGLTRRYSVRSRLSWYGTEEKDTNVTSDTWRFLLSLTRPVGRKSGLSLSYSYADRKSDNPGDSYKENRVALFFNTNYQGIPGYGFRY
ncbi:MAG: hypothetical protein IEMM0001_1315 [bacterium]|nr:MAG: hypothetical protein IEMM0001_1315 [bacterium]